MDDPETSPGALGEPNSRGKILRRINSGKRTSLLEIWIGRSSLAGHPRGVYFNRFLRDGINGTIKRVHGVLEVWAVGGASKEKSVSEVEKCARAK